MEGFIELGRDIRSCTEISGLTGHSTESSADQKESSSSLVTEPTTTEWTDEKHSLYLKSMEASFVNQLHNSMDLLGWNSERDNPHVDPHSSLGQFKVLRSGCWQQVNFRKGESQSNNADASRTILANPWVRHFRTACKDQVVASSTLQEKLASTSQKLKSSESKEVSYGLSTKSNHFPSWHFQSCRQDSVGSNEEESAQNFVDVKKEGEVGGACSAKRMKTQAATDGSSNDQVVPFDKESRKS